MWNDRIMEAVSRCRGDTLDLTRLRARSPAARRSGRPRPLAGTDRADQVSPADSSASRLPGNWVSAMPRTWPHPCSPGRSCANSMPRASRSAVTPSATPSWPTSTRTKPGRKSPPTRRSWRACWGSPCRSSPTPTARPRISVRPMLAWCASSATRRAVTTVPGVATAATDRYPLPRFSPWEHSPTRFGLRLLHNLGQRFRV